MGPALRAMCLPSRLRFFRNAHAPDLPGRGEAAGPESISSFTAFVAKYIEQNRLEDVVLCGHSMGGAVALQAAVQGLPIRAVVMLASGARLRVAPALLRMLEQDFESGITAIAQMLFARPSPAQLDFAIASMRRSGAQTLRDYRACDAFDSLAQLAALRVPLLAVTGEQDRMTPVKFARAMAEAVPGASAQIVPDAGHMVMLESPAAVNASVQAFLDARHESARETV